MKHSVKVLTVAAVLAATAAFPAPAAAAGTGWWASPGYLVTNSSFNPNETSVTVSTVANLKLKYTVAAAQTGQRAPVVADRLVYTRDDGGVTATDEATGVQKWRFELDPATFYPPAQLIHTDGKIVMAAPRIPMTAGYEVVHIFVLDAPTGNVAREFDEDGVVTEMLVDKGVLVVSGRSRYYPNTRAYRLADGQLLWKNSNKYMEMPVSANGRIVLYGDGVSGREYPSSNIVDLVTGNIIYTVANRHYWPLAADEAGTKFFVAAGNGTLQVLDAATGALSSLASNVYPKYAVVSPSRVYITSTGGTVIAVNRSTGAVIWTRKIPGSEYQRAIIAGGVLYVTAKGDRVHTLNPVDGTALNVLAFTTGTVDQLVVTYGRVYATDGAYLTVYGL